MQNIMRWSACTFCTDQPTLRSELNARILASSSIVRVGVVMQAVVVHDRPLIAGEIKFQTPESLTMKTRLAYIIYLLSAYREVWSAHVGPQHKSLALQRLRPCAGAVSLGGDRPPWRSLTLPQAPPRTRTCRPAYNAIMAARARARTRARARASVASASAATTNLTPSVATPYPYSVQCEMY